MRDVYGRRWIVFEHDMIHTCNSPGKFPILSNCSGYCSVNSRIELVDEETDEDRLRKLAKGLMFQKILYSRNTSSSGELNLP